MGSAHFVRYIELIYSFGNLLFKKNKVKRSCGNKIYISRQNIIGL